MFGDEFKLRQIQRRYGSEIHDNAHATFLLYKPPDELRAKSVTFIRSITFEGLPSANFSVGQRGMKRERGEVRPPFDGLNNRTGREK